MPKPKQKLKPDIILKNYWSDNERFADLFNAVLFHGRQMIRPEELKIDDSEESFVLEHREHMESIKASRDTLKIRKVSTVYGVRFVLLGLENQENVHYAMPMRVMGYDYAAYKKQYDSNAHKYKEAKGMDKDEYLSRMRKTDKFFPVITLVVYYGEKGWDGAKSLHEMLNIPFEMKNYVNDYKMLLLEARKNDLIFHNINNSDLFSLLGILLDKERTSDEIKKDAIEYANEHHVDQSVIMAVASAANCTINYHTQNGKGEADMYTVFEETRQKGFEQGQQQGEISGLAKGIVMLGMEVGLSEDDILMKLQNALHVSRQQAKEYYVMYQSFDKIL